MTMEVGSEVGWGSAVCKEGGGGYKLYFFQTITQLFNRFTDSNQMVTISF